MHPANTANKERATERQSAKNIKCSAWEDKDAFAQKQVRGYLLKFEKKMHANNYKKKFRKNLKNQTK